MDIRLFELINNEPYYDGKRLNITINSQGYCYVSLLGKNRRLHRIIAQRYIPNLFQYKVVEHINGNKKDNRIINLKWVSYSENSKLAYHSVKSMKVMHKFTKGREIVSIKNAIETVHKSQRECAKFVNRNVAAVSRVLKGEWRYCNGYELKYKD